jgi:hypothetical protein
MVLKNKDLEENYEPTEEWRKFLNGELHNLYSPPNIIRVIKLRKMRWGM